MLRHAMNIFLCRRKSRTLSLLLVPSSTRFREDLQVYCLKQGVAKSAYSPCERARTSNWNQKDMLMECYFARNISWSPRIVHSLQNNYPRSIEDGTIHCTNEGAGNQNEKIVRGVLIHLFGNKRHFLSLTMKIIKLHAKGCARRFSNTASTGRRKFHSTHTLW